MTDTQPPPFHRVDDQARAWRAIAAICDHDGAMFEALMDETRSDGYQAIDRLVAALARNFVLRVRQSIGIDGIHELITTELTAADAHRESS